MKKHQPLIDDFVDRLVLEITYNLLISAPFSRVPYTTNPIADYRKRVHQLSQQFTIRQLLILSDEAGDTLIAGLFKKGKYRQHVHLAEHVLAEPEDNMLVLPL